MISNFNDILSELPGMDCGNCGYKSCYDFANFLINHPEEIKRCIYLNKSCSCISDENANIESLKKCISCSNITETESSKFTWKDSLERDFDFVLDTFVNEPGPREIIIPHNPIRVRELDIKKDDILIGRPLGLSCGCPITHSGYVIDVDQITGIITWCVTGPLNPRNIGYKDLGYYSAQAYEGLVNISKVELKIGMRYWFLPHRCMLQWRHSGLINFINKTKDGIKIRVEGLFIG